MVTRENAESELRRVNIKAWEWVIDIPDPCGP